MGKEPSPTKTPVEAARETTEVAEVWLGGAGPGGRGMVGGGWRGCRGHGGHLETGQWQRRDGRPCALCPYGGCGAGGFPRCQGTPGDMPVKEHHPLPQGGRDPSPRCSKTLEGLALAPIWRCLDPVQVPRSGVWRHSTPQTPAAPVPGSSGFACPMGRPASQAAGETPALVPGAPAAP